mgnify:CR=1 FL=1
MMFYSHHYELRESSHISSYSSHMTPIHSHQEDTHDDYD